MPKTSILICRQKAKQFDSNYRCKFRFFAYIYHNQKINYSATNENEHTQNEKLA